MYSATIKGLCSFFLMDTSNCLSNFGEYLLSDSARDVLLKLNICPRTKATYHNAAFLIDVRKSKVFYEFQLMRDLLVFRPLWMMLVFFAQRAMTNAVTITLNRKPAH